MSVPSSGAKLRVISSTADQVLSSLSNGLILYSVAVVSTAEYFGRISLVLTLLAAAVGCLRGALGTPLLLMAAKDRAEIRREGSYAVTAALVLSPILALVMWLLDGQSIGRPMILVAIATPIVLVQDVLRYVVIAEGRPHLAAIWDGTWFLGSLGLLISTWLGWRFVDVDVLIGGWGALAFIALVGLAVGLRMRPRVRGFIGWLAENWQHRVRYGLDAGLQQGGYFVTLAAVTAMVGPVTTAALRGSTALMAPISMLTSAIPLVLIPESTRRADTARAVWQRLSHIAVITSAGCLVAGVALSVLPNRIGTFVLGDSFELAQHIIMITTIDYTIAVWLIAVMVWLKTFNRSAALLTLKSVYVGVTLVLALGGAVIFSSAIGIAAGMAIGSTVVTSLALALFTPWRKEAVGEIVDAEPELTEPEKLRRTPD